MSGGRDAAEADATVATMSRLRWRCRRGMLELDLLLGNFLERGYDELSRSERVVFVRILEYPDRVLLGWLTGQQAPTDREVGHIVDRIRGLPPP